MIYKNSKKIVLMLVIFSFNNYLKSMERFKGGMNYAKEFPSKAFNIVKSNYNSIPDRYKYGFAGLAALGTAGYYGYKHKDKIKNKFNEWRINSLVQDLKSIKDKIILLRSNIVSNKKNFSDIEIINQKKIFNNFINNDINKLIFSEEELQEKLKASEQK